MRRHRVEALVVVLLLVAAGAAGDPRWWTHDRAITSGPQPKAWPDVVMPGYVSGGASPFDTAARISNVSQFILATWSSV